MVFNPAETHHCSQQRKSDVALKPFIRQVVLARISLLPIRMYDITSGAFVTRKTLCKTVEAQTFEACYKRDPQLFCHEGSSDQPRICEDRIKNFIKQSTNFTILSHTWGTHELSYQDVVRNHRCLSKDPKFSGLCQTARKYGCRYVWMDSVCIDQSSSSELDTSIRAMYTWYQTAYVCIVYLQEFDWETNATDRWFTRGWTLQELLAPRRITFFQKDWERIFLNGEKFDITRHVEAERHDYRRLANRLNWSSKALVPLSCRMDNTSCGPADSEWSAGLAALQLFTSPTDDTSSCSPPPSFTVSPEELIADLTGIPLEDINSYRPSPEHARKVFTYMRNRSTTVDEDAAYCLIGLLGISLSIAYGEGVDCAMHRLQVSCAESSDDRNIFLWDSHSNQPSRFHSMLPSNPFDGLPSTSSLPGTTYGEVVSVKADGLWDYTPSISGACGDHIDPTFQFTNSGLRISVILHDLAGQRDDSIYLKCAKQQGIRIITPFKSRAQFKRLSSQILPVKLAVLGTYGSLEEETHVYAILLEKLGNTRVPKYRRMHCTVVGSTLPPFDVLLSRHPETVYIK